MSKIKYIPKEKRVSDTLNEMSHLAIQMRLIAHSWEYHQFRLNDLMKDEPKKGSIKLK